MQFVNTLFQLFLLKHLDGYFYFLSTALNTLKTAYLHCDQPILKQNLLHQPNGTLHWTYYYQYQEPH